MKFIQFPLLGLKSRNSKNYKLNLALYKNIMIEASEHNIKLTKFAYQIAMDSFKDLENLAGNFKTIKNF